MAIAFDRSLRALRAERQFGFIGLILFLIFFLGIWFAWLVTARVPLMLSTPFAKIESSTSIVSLTSPITGTIKSISLKLGQSVKKGQVIAVLRSDKLQLRLKEEKAQIRAFSSRLGIIRQQIRQKRQGLRHYGIISRKARKEVEMRHQRVKLEIQDARQRRQQMQRLSSKGYIAREKLNRVRLEIKKLKIQTQELLEQVGRIRWEYKIKEDEQRGRIIGHQRSVRDLQGSIAVRKIALQRLRLEIKQHQIHVVKDGKISSLIPIQRGAVVGKGQLLGTLLPKGSLHVVAQFSVAKGMGKVREGQLGRLRLHAFPWMQYGALQVRVKKVATVSHQKMLRIELALIRSNPRIPMQHGLTGIIEIETEKISPFNLLLRFVGKWVEKNEEKKKTVQGGF